MILPWQIILVWVTISALTGVISGLLISEAKNWLYILGNTLVCAFVGIIAGGIFVALTDGLNWEFYSFLIPFIIGGATSFVIGAYLREQLPKPSRDIKPAVVALELIVIIGLCLVSAIPAGRIPTTPAGIVDHTAIAIDVDDVTLFGGSGRTTKLVDVTTVNVDPSSQSFQQLKNYPIIPIEIEAYHTSIDYPTKIAEDPEEGEYMTFKFTFSVPGGSPVKWEEPVIYLYCWGDVNGNGILDKTGDIVYLGTLEYQPFKFPTDENTLVSCPCVYDSNGNPMVALYAFPADSTFMCLPNYFAVMTDWKDEEYGGYVFANTPEGFEPIGDMASWQYHDNVIELMEDVYAWVPISIGSSKWVEGKLYCADGMASTSNDWYFTVVAFDWAYSYSEPITVHDMHFTVGEPAAEPPIVNIASEYWVVAGLFAFFGVASIVATKFGKKII